MMTGMIYDAGSASGTGVSESDISDLNKPVFTIPNLPPGASATINYTARAGCEIISIIEAGSLITDKITVKHNGGSESKTTDPYVVESPSLSITNFVNQVYSGNHGDQVVRTITITNGGLGGLTDLKLYIVNGADIQLTNLDKTNVTTSGDSTIVTLDAADFSAIGNGDAFLDENESITIEETIIVGGCGTNDYQSEYYLAWGCNGQVCQNPFTTSDIVFPNNTPDLEIKTTPFIGTCYEDGVAKPQQLRLVNTGTGIAKNLKVHVYHALNVNGAPANNYISNIDTSSVTIRTSTG